MTTEEVQLIYAENIRRRRIEKGLTQEQLAEKIGMSPKYISDIETARKPGSLDTIIQIGNVLDYEMYEIFLPNSKTISYDSKRTKQLMTKLRSAVNDILNVMEEYLAE